MIRFSNANTVEFGGTVLTSTGQFNTTDTLSIAFTRDSSDSVRIYVGGVLKKTGYKTGNEVRLVMWTVTLEEIAKHPLGVGTGNVDAHLSQRLKQYGQLDLAKQDEHDAIQYNPHNQFLQTGLEIGLFGLFVLLFFIVQTWRLARTYKSYLLMAVVASLVVNSLFESMLQRQSGIVFYAFWICLLTVISVTNTKIQAQEE
jgi:O-antigen ligase